MRDFDFDFKFIVSLTITMAAMVILSWVCFYCYFPTQEGYHAIYSHAAFVGVLGFAIINYVDCMKNLFQC